MIVHFLKNRFLTLVLGLALVIAPAYANPIAGKVIPGKSIGKLELGMSSLQVTKLLGLPDASKKSSQGYDVNIWLYADGQTQEINLDPLTIYTEQSTQGVLVYFEEGRAIYIETTSRNAMAPHNISVGRPLIVAKKYHQNMNVSTFQENEYSNYTYYDDVHAGITFAVASRDYFNYWRPISYIGVHQAGVPVPMTLFGKLVSQNYEKEYLGSFRDENFDPRSIIPGKSFGLIELGMTPKQVSDAILGTPNDEGTTPQGYDVKSWDVTSDGSQGDDPLVTVYFKNGVAFYIEGNREEGIAPNGITDGTALGKALQKYPASNVNAYTNRENEGSQSDRYVYDNLSAGITFVVQPSSYFDHSEPVGFIGVHPQGQKAPVPLGYAPTEAILNRPPKQKNTSTSTKSLFAQNGLPITEIVTTEGAHRLTTSNVITPSGITFQCTVLIRRHGTVPKITFDFSHPNIGRVLGMTFSYAGKRLEFDTVSKSNDLSRMIWGRSFDAWEVTVPIKDFWEITSSKDMYIDISSMDNVDFHDHHIKIDKKYLAGLRALRAKVASK